MYPKEITYHDFNDVELTETFYFNLSEAELAKMELTTEGGLRAYIKKILAAHDMPALTRLFDRLILASYGIKSDDGKRFMKKCPTDGHMYADDFKETDAYSVLFIQLCSDDNAASDFLNGVIPANIAAKVKEIEEEEKKNKNTIDGKVTPLSKE